MEILRTISFYAEAKDISFLLIGGHAVHHYGLSRQTGDIDFVISRDDYDWWIDLLLRLKYKAGQQDDNFARFRPDSIGEWPIDLMLVNPDTFKKLLEQSEPTQIGTAEVRVISARHLATFKIHALKQLQEHRYAKDYNDLLYLLRSGKTELTKSELEGLCERYASTELYDRLDGDWKI